MFSSITWELFLTTACIIIGSYYSITTLLLYHWEITQWIKSRGQRRVVKTASSTVPASPFAVMGNIQEESIQTLRSSVETASCALQLNR